MRILLNDDESRIFLMMPVRVTNENCVEVMMDSDQNGSWTPLAQWRGFKRAAYGYFLSIIDLSAELCLGRNHGALVSLQEMYSYDTVK